MALDPRRLVHELQQVAAVPGATLCRRPNSPVDAWSSYFAVLVVGRYRATVHVSDNHPYEHPRIEINPPPQAAHYGGGSLCWAGPNEWKPTYTVAVAVIKAKHFMYLVARRQI